MKRLSMVLAVLMMLCLAAPSLAEVAPVGSAQSEELPMIEDSTDTPADMDETAPAAEEEGAETPVYDEFIIGATTRLSGNFFTNMWGNNTCDIDVRSLIHGYSPVVWTMQSRFETNPYVVEDVTVGELDDGGKLYMVTLWADLKYSDGSRITARDYVFSLMLFADPVIRELGGITTNVDYIVGYDEYYAGETNVFSGIRLVDEYTFMIEIKAECLPFFFELAYLDCIPYPISVIAPGCAVADDGQGVYIRNIDESVAEPLWNTEHLRETIMDPETGYLSHPYVTSGPYMLTSFDWDTRVATFELNPYYKCYYDGQKPTIDNLVFKSVLPETMMEEYENGEVHLLNKVVAAENIVEGTALVSAGEAQMVPYPRMGLGFISFSCEQGPAQFESVRKAIAYCLDRTEYKEAYLQDYGIVVNGYYGVGQWMVQMIEGTSQMEYVETDEEQAEWDALVETGLSFMTEYTLDLDMAKQILVDDGWTLNAQGEAYREGVDEVRWKRLDNGTLMELRMHWGKMEDSIAADLLEERLAEPFQEIGIALDITVVPFTDLIEHYYRQTDRTYDMMYLATNFISIFDPYFVFNTADAYQGPQNTTGYRDEQLEALALDLRQTEQGALLEYCRKWVAFQDYFNEVLPMLPLYSNVYFDFHVTDLQSYAPSSEMNWPIAILYATIGEPPAAELVEVEGQDGAADAGDNGDMSMFIED